MPPCLDIYIVANRTKEVVGKFIGQLVDTHGSEGRLGDLMMLPFGARTISIPSESWEWEPSISLAHVVERGLDQPWRAFAVSLVPSTMDFAGATLAFTADGRVVLGLSLDDEDGRPETLNRAKSVLSAMANAFGGDIGFIGSEEPPPLLPESMVMGNWIHRWDRGEAAPA